MNGLDLLLNYLDVFEEYDGVQAYASDGFFVVTKGGAAKLTLSDGIDNPLCRVGSQQEVKDEWHCNL